MLHALTDTERKERLQGLADWSYDPERRALCRSVRFPTFMEAIAAMTRIALAADRMNHHPEWFNVYDRLDVRLTTHDVGDVSIKDVELARTIDVIIDPYASTRRTADVRSVA